MNILQMPAAVRISAQLGTYLIFELLRWALIRGGTCVILTSNKRPYYIQKYILSKFVIYQQNKEKQTLL